MLLILPSAFLVSLGIGIVNLGMLWIVRSRYGASPATASVFAASWSMAYFTGCILLRPLSSRLSARSSMATMALGTATLFGLHALLPGLASAFATFLAYGILTALFWPRVMGWLSTGLEGEALSKASGKFSLSWSLGGVISPYLAGVLAERDLFLPLWISIAVFAAAGVFILGTFRVVPSPEPTRQSRTFATEDRSTPLRWPAWIGVFLAYALAAVFFNIFPLFAKDDLKLPESRIGFILLVRALATTAGFWFFGRFGFWHSKRRYILLPILTGLLLALSFTAIRGSAAFGIALAAFGFVLALAYSASMFYGASGAADRERRMTIHEALLTAGQIAGSLAGGWIYQRYSWGSIFVALSVLFIAGALAQLRFLGKMK